jgi:peptidoglycan/LPS O-acetylase OafA/YrhL
VQAWGFAGSIVGPAWSISTEWGAYLVFPVLVYFALSPAKWPPLFLAQASWICLLFIAYFANQFVLGSQAARLGPLDLYGQDTVAPLVRCIASFSLGLLSYRWRAYFKSIYAAPLTGAMLIVLLWPGTDLIFVAICFALIPSLSHDEGIVAHLLGSKFVFTLGVWSYSIYILHARFNPVRTETERFLVRWHVMWASQFAVLVSTCAVVLCAALTYRFIEKPGRSLLRRVFDRSRESEVL